MDPRTAWYTPEQLGSAHRHWVGLWENCGVHSTMIHLNNNSNLEHKSADFIPLDYTNRFDQKHAPSNFQQNLHNLQKRKYENKASTYALNHSSNLDDLTGLTPWLRCPHGHGDVYSSPAVRYVLYSLYFTILSANVNYLNFDIVCILII